MKNQLTVEEKFSRLWPTAAVVSLFAALIFYLLYVNTENALNESYFRVLSFAFFAAGILVLFKLKDGKITLRMEVSANRELSIHYQTKRTTIAEEVWNLDDIASVKIDEMPNNSLSNDIVRGDRCIKVRYRNHTDWIYLNNLSNRVIPLKKEDAKRVMEFIQRNLEEDPPL